MIDVTASVTEPGPGRATWPFGSLGIALGLILLQLSCTYFGGSAPPCPERPTALANAGSLGTIPTASPERGHDLFGEHCATCHAPERSGRFFLFREIPRLNCPDYASSASPAYLFRVISQGGRSVGESRVMPGFADRLSREEIASLVSYIRSAGDAAPPRP